MTLKNNNTVSKIADYQKSFSSEIRNYILKTEQENSTAFKPLVSIITVVFNGGETLQKTIDSIKEQTYKNIEYIIIDGGSTDNTLDIIKSNDEWVSFWISEKDSGIYDAMNKGISIAKGDLIGILNADDFYKSDTVENVVDSFLESKGDIFHGDALFLKGNEVLFTLQPASNLSIHSFKEMPLNHVATFIPKTVYQELGLYDTSYKIAADWEFVLRAFLNKKRFVYIPKTLTYFSLEGISTTQAKVGTKEIFSTLKRRQLIKRPLLDILYIIELLKREVKRYDNNAFTKMLFSALRKYKKRVLIVKEE